MYFQIIQRPRYIINKWLNNIECHISVLSMDCLWLLLLHECSCTASKLFFNDRNRHHSIFPLLTAAKPDCPILEPMFMFIALVLYSMKSGNCY